MSTISAIQSRSPAPITVARVPNEAREIPGAPDHDGDADDRAPAAPARAATPLTVGKTLDKFA